jgi:thiol-disulfide isomerase/thioredoxin
MLCMMKRVLLAFAVLLPSIALGQNAVAPALACGWKAEITATRANVEERYQVPFVLQIEQAAGGLRAALVNGSSRVEFTSVEQHAREVTLRLDQYDSAMTLHCVAERCEKLEGEYVRHRGDREARYPVVASCGAQPKESSVALTALEITGAWQYEFTKPDGSKPESEAEAPGSFAQQGHHLEGTIAPISGDYGTLSGEISEGGEVHLSRFDGVHLLRLDGKVLSAKRIEGVFHEAAGAALNFVATRTAAEEGFAEAERVTTVADPSEPFHFGGMTPLGTKMTQADPQLRGKVVLVDIFGTWCPNCHDEAPVLAWLYEQYHSRGLEIVGLDYEYVNDPARSQRLIAVYRRKYNVSFPILLAGTTDQGEVEKSLPQLHNFGAFPTTIFLDRHGRVKLIHSGFSGPATGRLDELKEHFRQTVEKMLTEP